MAGVRQAKPLSELLVEQGVLTAEQLQTVQAKAATQGCSLKQAITQQGLLTEADLMKLLAEQSGMTTVELSNYLIKPEVIQAVPEALARKHVVVPLFKIAQSLTVAIADPLNFFALDEVRLKSRCEIKAVLATESAIRHAIDQYYGAAGTIEEVAKVLEAAEAPASEERAAGEAPVIRLVDLLVIQALKEGASDVHIEPQDQLLRTRLRIDGILHEVAGPPKHLHASVVSRIKVLANLDVAEHRKPQDGRFRLRMDQKDIDLRVSTVPTQFGEKVVMRLLDSANVLRGLEQLGLAPESMATFVRLIHAPHGILLVTGPTGSGKTTTLYAALHDINSTEKNILTIEDPIEYQLAGVNQVQVNPKAEVTFASALRSFLRQDPDVIMVGEIRDRETADIAIQAALTGHLVLSTLHPNDAPGGMSRLMDMDVEPFLLASSVVGVVAQRLVRAICPKCKAPYRPPATIAQQAGVTGEASLFRGAGCDACKRTGYKGRVAIFELMPVTDEIRERVAVRAPSHVLRETARSGRMATLYDDGMAKVRAGITTIEEVLRVTQLE